MALQSSVTLIPAPAEVPPPPRSTPRSTLSHPLDTVGSSSPKTMARDLDKRRCQGAQTVRCLSWMMLRNSASSHSHIQNVLRCRALSNPANGLSDLVRSGVIRHRLKTMEHSLAPVVMASCKPAPETKIRTCSTKACPYAQSPRDGAGLSLLKPPACTSGRQLRLAGTQMVSQPCMPHVPGSE